MQTPLIKQKCLITIFPILLLLTGCSTSDKSTNDQTTGKRTSATEQIAADVKNRADSISAKAQTEKKIPPRPNVYGKYAVQIGAYATSENAQKIADIAKERFDLLIYAYYDKTDNLYKIFLGDFLIKEEARNYRDNMVRRYPGEYNDAWVSEHPAQ